MLGQIPTIFCLREHRWYGTQIVGMGSLRFAGRMPYFANIIVRTKLPCGVSSR